MRKRSYCSCIKLTAILLTMTLLLTGCSFDQLPGAGSVRELIRNVERLVGLSNTDGHSGGDQNFFSSGTETDMEGYWIAGKTENFETAPKEPDDFSYVAYYLEFRGDKVTVRDYSRTVVLETSFSVTDGGEDTGYALLITLEDGGLSYDDGSAYGTIDNVVMRDGRIQFTETYAYDTSTVYEYIGIQTEEGPFDYLQILDDQYLGELQGQWVDPDAPYAMLSIEGSTLSDMFVEEGEKPYVLDSWEFHVVCVKNAPDYIFLISDDLVQTCFGGYSEISYSDEKLHTYEMILDADWDTSLHFEKVKE